MNKNFFFKIIYKSIYKSKVFKKYLNTSMYLVFKYNYKKYLVFKYILSMYLVLSILIQKKVFSAQLCVCVGTFDDRLG